MLPGGDAEPRLEKFPEVFIAPAVPQAEFMQIHAVGEVGAEHMAGQLDDALPFLVRRDRTVVRLAAAEKVQQIEVAIAASSPMVEGIQRKTGLCSPVCQGGKTKPD